MAVNFDSKSSVAGGGAVVSWSHKCQGTNRYLQVFITTDAEADTPVSVTYNGDAMTQIASRVDRANCESFLYELINPDSGTNTITVTMGTTGNIICSAISFVDVHQTTPSGTPSTESANSGTAPSLDISSASDEIVADYVSTLGGAATLTVGASQTERTNLSQSASHTQGSSTETGAGTTTMSWTISGAQKFNHIAVAVKPATLDGDTLAFAYADDDAGTGASTDTLTVAATMSGSNRVLLVAVHWVGTRTVTSVTYAGTAMTSVRSEISPNDPKQNVHVFKLSNPSPGANNIVLTMSGAASSNALGWMQFTGGHQSDAVDDVDGFNEASGSAPDNLSSSLTLTSNTTQICADFITLGNNTPTVGADQTLRYSDTTSAKLFGSTQAGAASVEMSWTWGTDDNYSHIALGVKQFSRTSGFFAVFNNFFIGANN